MGAVIRTILVLALLAVSCGFLAAQPQKGQPIHEKIIIPKVDPFEHKVTLPPDVLKALLNDDGIKSMRRYTTDYQRSHPDILFGASEARLGRPDEVDFIVFGMPPLCGVSFDWYWVVRPTPKKPKVILSASGNVIELMDTRTNGYRDLRTVGGTHWEIHEEVYHFDGNKYKLWKKRRAENNRE